jgi:hypothetical protein
MGTLPDEFHLEGHESPKRFGSPNECLTGDTTCAASTALSMELPCIKSIKVMEIRAEQPRKLCVYHGRGITSIWASSINLPGEIDNSINF